MPDSEFAGSYRIVEAIGEGAMGTVYRATRTSDGHTCALKVLKPAIASDQAKATERFGREARVGERIGHPQIVKVYDTGFDERTGLHWLSMEFLDGLPLTQFMEQRRPNRPTRLELIQQLLGAMVAAHAAGVLHRDLKPDNLFVIDVDTKPALKVLDFGVAKTLRAGMVMSATEGGLGTPLWTAPEQGKGGDHMRPAVDVWALGLLIFYMLTGKLYWFHCNNEASSMLDIAKEMLRDPIEPASTRAKQLGVGAGLPDGIDAWFSRCVVREVDQRFEDAAATSRAWHDMLAGKPVTPSSPPPPNPSPIPVVAAPTTLRSTHPGPPSKRKITLVVVGVVVLGVLAAIIAWLAMR